MSTSVEQVSNTSFYNTSCTGFKVKAHCCWLNPFICFNKVLIIAALSCIYNCTFVKSINHILFVLPKVTNHSLSHRAEQGLTSSDLNLPNRGKRRNLRESLFQDKQKCTWTKWGSVSMFKVFIHKWIPDRNEGRSYDGWNGVISNGRMCVSAYCISSSLAVIIVHDQPPPRSTIPSAAGPEQTNCSRHILHTQPVAQA